MHSERTVNRVELQLPLKCSLALLTSPGIFFLDFFPLFFLCFLFFSSFIFPPLELAKGQGEKGSAT